MPILTISPAKLFLTCHIGNFSESSTPFLFTTFNHQFSHFLSLSVWLQVVNFWNVNGFSFACACEFWWMEGNSSKNTQNCLFILLLRLTLGTWQVVCCDDHCQRQVHQVMHWVVCKRIKKGWLSLELDWESKEFFIIFLLLCQNLPRNHNVNFTSTRMKIDEVLDAL